MAALASDPPGNGAPDTRTRILEVAASLLARFTISKLTLDDVARAAGVSRQAIYRHFEGKDDLLIELFVQELETNHAPAVRQLDGEPSAERLVELFSKEVDLSRNYNLYNEVLTPGLVARMAELVLGSPKLAAAREALWVPILEKYEAAGVLRPGLDHRAVVRWMTWLQYWLVTQPTVLCDDDETLRSYVREFVVAALVER